MDRLLNYSRISTDENFSSTFEADIEDNASETTKVPSSTEFLVKKHNRENSLPGDLEHRSSERLSKRTSFPLRNRWTWLRWTATFGLQIAIIMLLLNPRHQQDATGEPFIIPRPSTMYDKSVETGSDINGIYKTCPCNALDWCLFLNVLLMNIDSIPFVHFSQAGIGEIRP